ncbi:ribosome assembly factor SBDS [Candidatus Woesearchaeota archaeon]|nr:ribosome assembly factor SBDS [Candidatus Woesearchaeota archaeon]
MKGDQMYGGERPSFNIARLKTAGEKFEVAINPDAAMDLKAGKPMSMKDVILSDKIFSDAHKGLLASEHTLKNVFKTDNHDEMIAAIISKGEIQLTAEYRDKKREQKLNWIINTIHKNGIDPRTNLPHPPQRIANAIEEAKLHIDDHKRAEDQLNDIIKGIRPILPIRFEIREIEVKIPAQHASKSYSILKNHGTILEDSWQNDGSLSARIEVPAGLQQELFDQLNKLTHGSCETKIIKSK